MTIRARAARIRLPIPSATRRSTRCTPGVSRDALVGAPGDPGAGVGAPGRPGGPRRPGARSGARRPGGPASRRPRRRCPGDPARSARLGRGPGSRVPPSTRPGWRLAPAVPSGLQPRQSVEQVRLALGRRDPRLAPHVCLAEPELTPGVAPEPHERVLLADLGDVRAEGLPALVEMVAHVDPCRHGLVGNQHLRSVGLEFRELLRRRVLGRTPERALADRLQAHLERVPDGRRDGLLVQLGRRPGREPPIADRRAGAGMLGRQLLRVPGRVAGPRERPDRHEVGSDVVRVPVAAEVVVGGHHVRPVSPDEEHEAPDGLVHVRLPEAARVAVARPAHHVRVPVAQVLPLGHAERAHGPLQLHRAQLTEPTMVVRRVELRHDDLTHLAAGAGHQDHAVAVGDGLGHRAAGADGLVVGMRVHGHQGEGTGGGLGRLVDHGLHPSAVADRTPGGVQSRGRHGCPAQWPDTTREGNRHR